MVVEILKRDGRTVPFEREKIKNAIIRAALSVTTDNIDESIASDLADCVVWYLNGKFSTSAPPTVEQVQDAVEKILIENGHAKTAKAYILYRAERNRTRDMSNSLMKTYEDLTFKFSKDMDLKRENANINTDTAMGTMLKYGSEGAKKFNHLYLLDNDASEAHINGDIHIHDLDFYALTETCLDASMTLVLRHKGETLVVTAGDFDKFLNSVDIDVPVYLKDYEILSGSEFVPLVNVVRHRANGKQMLKISSKAGDLLVTEDHRVSIKVGDSFEDIYARDIKPGMELVSGITKLSGNLFEVDLIDLLKDKHSDDISIANTLDILNWLNCNQVFDILKSVVSKGRYNSLRDCLKGNRCTMLTLSEYLLLESRICIDRKLVRLTSQRNRTGVSLSAVLPLTKELGKFIGYMYSEGSTSTYLNKKSGNVEYSASFVNYDGTLLTDFNTVTSSVFDGPLVTSERLVNGKSAGWNLNGRLTCLLFDGPLGVKHGASEIKMPEWIYAANDDFLCGFLGALIDGDGCVQKDGYRISYTSIAGEFVQQLQMLLNLRGVSSSVVRRKDKGSVTHFGNKESIRNYDSYVLSITGSLKNYVNMFDSFKVKSQTWRETVDRAKDRYVIISVTPCDSTSPFVYDCETGNHHFSANGFYVHNCAQIPLDKLFSGGFSTGHGYLREPNSIQSYSALACIAIQSNQNDQHGGQSIPAFDYYMAPGVAKTMITELVKVIDTRYDDIDIDALKSDLKDVQKKHTLILNDEVKAEIKGICDKYISKLSSNAFNKLWEKALKYADKATHQAMEALIHNLNSMHSRAGSQVTGAVSL